MRSQTILLKLIILGAGLLLCGCGLYPNHTTNTNPPAAAPPNQDSSPAAKGPAAPEIVLPDLTGQTARLSDYRGQVVILNFWASWCPPCRGEMPELEQASQEFGQGSEAVLITVNLTDGSRETAAQARQYIQANGYTMPVWLDTAGQAADAYNITSIPTTMVIDQQGHITARIFGPTTKAVLQGYVDQLQ